MRPVERGEGGARAVDRHFGDALARWAGRAPGSSAGRALRAVGTLLSAELGRQHSCLALARVHELARLAGLEGELPEDVATVATLLRDSGLLGTGRDAPLVLEDGRLYLTRYHGYERTVAEALAARAGAVEPAGADPARLAVRLAALFPNDEDAVDWQRVGAAMALDRRLAVITGGPGTGKTTTVTRMLLVLLEEAGDAPLRIRLAAPTGKAAARLTESVRQSKARLAAEGRADAAVLERLPETAETLHRLLGWRPLENRFRHGAERRVPADVVVVDEASMVDLRMMARLLEALAPETRLVLLGDRDQLSSVEAGRVLADLCAWTERHFVTRRLSRTQAERLGALTGFDLAALAGEAVPALADCLCLLERSHRFDPASAMGRFAAAVNGGDAERALAELRRRAPGLTWSGEGAAPAALVTDAADRYEAAVTLAATPGAEPEAALAAFGRYQLLAATRGGPFGVEALNAAVEGELARRGRIRPDLPFHAGRPVMIVVNDYALGLYNGDTGVVLVDEDGRTRVWFAASDGGVRAVAPTRLPAHETIYAMTVHKSQGSEFDAVTVVLPDDPTENEQRLLTREMLYTAVTRARSTVHVHAGEAVLRRTVARRTERASGLRARLWGAGFDDEAAPALAGSAGDADAGPGPGGEST